MSRRLGAILALLGGGLALAIAAYVFITDFPRGLVVLACVFAALVLVSNNPYLLGPTLGTGTRPRLDSGTLGIVDFHPPTPGVGEQVARWRELAAAELEIEADGPVAVGIDGESLTLEPPLRFRVRQRALRARIAREHPGASPSAEIPHGPLGVLKELLRVAGR